MDCPRCSVPLKKLVIDDIELDECPQCVGVWFDQGELDQARNMVDPDLSWWDFDIWSRQEQFRLAPQPIQCPNCRADMFAFNYAETEIEVDVCSQCKGVWLDGGEFEKIIAALNDELATANVSDLVGASLQEAKEIVTGPKGFKSEWKDFSTVLRLMQYRLFIDKPRLVQELLDGQKGAPIW
jgi:Zn-finger nucleic acid-binding protein